MRLVSFASLHTHYTISAAFNNARHPAPAAVITDAIGSNSTRRLSGKSRTYAASGCAGCATRTRSTILFKKRCCAPSQNGASCATRRSLRHGSPPSRAISAREWNRAYHRRKRAEASDKTTEAVDSRNPLDALEKAEERELLKRAMARLNDSDREILRARYLGRRILRRAAGALRLVLFGGWAAASPREKTAAQDLHVDSRRAHPFLRKFQTYGMGEEWYS